MASSRYKSTLAKKLSSFFERTFLEKKLNNWFGYLLITAFALGFGYLLVKDSIVALSIFGGLFALCVAIICMSSAKAGLYIIVGYSFFAYYFANLSTFFLSTEMPVGLFVDLLISMTMIGIIIWRNDFRKNLNLFVKSTLVIFIFFTLFFSAIQFFNPNSQSIDTNILAFRKFLGYVFIMFICFTVFDSYTEVKNFIVFIFIIATISALYGIKQQWFGYFNYEMQLILSDPKGFALIFVGGEFRKASTMSDPASFGVIMAVCATFFLILATNQAKQLYKVILATGAVFMLMAMGYSGTRTAYAIIVVALAFFVLLNFNKKSTRVFGLIASVVVLFLLFAPIYGSKTIQRFRTTFTGDKDESYKVRVLSRKFIQPFILSHPIGQGLGTTGFTGKEKHPGNPLADFQPDSGYVQRGAETGWSGLAEICVLYFIALWTGIRGFFSVKHEKIKIIYAACVTCLYAFYIAEFAQAAVGGISDSVVYYPILAIILKLKYYDSDTADLT